MRSPFTVAVVSALTTGLSLALALIFNGSLLEVLLGISLLQALVAAGALLFGYLAARWSSPRRGCGGDPLPLGRKAAAR